VAGPFIFDHVSFGVDPTESPSSSATTWRASMSGRIHRWRTQTLRP
jgi:hypothetical protein